MHDRIEEQTRERDLQQKENTELRDQLGEIDEKWSAREELFAKQVRCLWCAGNRIACCSRLGTTVFDSPVLVSQQPALPWKTVACIMHSTSSHTDAAATMATTMTNRLMSLLSSSYAPDTLLLSLSQPGSASAAQQC